MPAKKSKNRSAKKNLEELKTSKALIKIFPFSFELSFFSTGEISSLYFQLYLNPFKNQLLIGEDEKDLVDNFLREIENYFLGKSSYLNLPHFLEISPLVKKVLLTLREIPRGKVLTYGDLCKRVKGINSPRAIGRALSLNPFPLFYPCHRVIAKNGLGGFSQGPLLKWLLLYWENCLNFDSFSFVKKLI